MPVMVGPREYQRLNFGLLFAAFLSISSFKDGNCLKLLYSLQGSQGPCRLGTGESGLVLG